MVKVAAAGVGVSVSAQDAAGFLPLATYSPGSGIKLCTFACTTAVHAGQGKVELSSHEECPDTHASR